MRKIVEAFRYVWLAPYIVITVLLAARKDRKVDGYLIYQDGVLLFGHAISPRALKELKRMTYAQLEVVGCWRGVKK